MQRNRKLALAGALLIPVVGGGFFLQARPQREGAALLDQVMTLVSERFVDTLPKVTKDTLYRDSSVIGFALRVKPSGARTWVVQYRNAAGRTRKLAMKNSSAATPDEARRWAKVTLG